ncbi:hypothetical protein DESA109040_22170 [Deinococcus saxicola]
MSVTEAHSVFRVGVIKGIRCGIVVKMLSKYSPHFAKPSLIAMTLIHPHLKRHPALDSQIIWRIVFGSGPNAKHQVDDSLRFIAYQVHLWAA